MLSNDMMFDETKQKRLCVGRNCRETPMVVYDDEYRMPREDRDNPTTLLCYSCYELYWEVEKAKRKLFERFVLCDNCGKDIDTMNDSHFGESANYNGKQTDYIYCSRCARNRCDDGDASE